MDALGNTAYVVPFNVPANARCKCVFKATSKAAGKGWEAPTISLRWVTVETTFK